MLINTTGYWEAPDSGGGGGYAPSTNNADPSGAGSGGSDPSSSSTPTPLDIAEDTLIRLKGQDKPVRFQDHVKGFQAQATRAAQRAAQIERQLEQERARAAQYESDLRRYREQGQGAPQNGQTVLDQLKSLPYLSGEDAASVVGSIAQQFQQRDQILLAALQKMQQMQQIVQGLSSNHTNASFDAKINRWLQDGGYPPEAADLMKEVYLAYEGDDLDEEFPGIFKSRWENMQRAFESKRAATVAANRKRPFVPGRGGQANPSRPLQFKGNENAREMAEQLWESIGGGGSDT